MDFTPKRWGLGKIISHSKLLPRVCPSFSTIDREDRAKIKPKTQTQTQKSLAPSRDRIFWAIASKFGTLVDIGILHKPAKLWSDRSKNTVARGRQKFVRPLATAFFRCFLTFFRGLKRYPNCTTVPNFGAIAQKMRSLAGLKVLSFKPEVEKFGAYDFSKKSWDTCEGPLPTFWRSLRKIEFGKNSQEPFYARPVWNRKITWRHLATLFINIFFRLQKLPETFGQGTSVPNFEAIAQKMKWWKGLKVWN